MPPRPRRWPGTSSISSPRRPKLARLRQPGIPHPPPLPHPDRQSQPRRSWNRRHPRRLRATIATPIRGLGPYRPITKAVGRELTEQQREFLADLTRRYNAKTAGSKRLAQQHRSHLADPRTVAGFRLQWKECVYPITAKRSSGACIWDVDGNKYIDVAMGFGVYLLGHSPRTITRAIRRQLSDAWSIGPQTLLAGQVAEQIRDMTGMERVAFCNTGSEAVLAALRVARTVTGRDKIATFSDDYHGIFDEVLGRNVSVGGRPRRCRSRRAFRDRRSRI